MKFAKSSILVVLFLAVTGCMSIQSTMLHRDACNTAWEKKKLKGMPITLKVPTHVRVDVVETKYLVTDGTGSRYVKVNDCDVVKYEVKREQIVTEKIFTVDLKRPAAGTMDYTAKLSPADQYFTQVTSNLDDITIQEASKAFERILGALPTVAAPNAGKVPTAEQKQTETDSVTVTPVSSVIASEVFAFSNPMFEDNIRSFLQQSLIPRQTCDPAATDTNAFEETDPTKTAYIENQPLLPLPAAE